MAETNLFQQQFSLGRNGAHEQEICELAAEIFDRLLQLDLVAIIVEHTLMDHPRGS